ncbi:AAA family ATPase [Streptomyces aureoverticillatus]|uniref:AAA family ATPase n=1 Tax=Streptomyces aureoverticillatus TaxID=66871 RepID=UPI0013D9CE89|nr:AAA family ATPase [Streptomyces aureoverticillatus]QIB42696.1 AAA domain-containing protein [Streptomyces aureoverticillatus]
MTEQRDQQPRPTGGAERASGDWRLFRGDGATRHVTFPEAPPWRRFTPEPEPDSAPSPGGGAGVASPDAAGQGTRAARPYLIGPDESEIVNAALLLRRPLLVTGHPGTGKSSLAHAIAHELSLDRVLTWPVNSRSTLREALYGYDAIGRLRESNLRTEREGQEGREGHGGAETGAADRSDGDAPTRAPGSPGAHGSDIGSYVRLGPLGTALVPGERPRVLLVDELDKGDVDLPNDLLAVFEEGEFEIPELARLPEEESRVEVLTADPQVRAPVVRGRVRCTEFPVVVITSNGEREFPPAFLRRCVRLDLAEPDEQRLRDIVEAHLGDAALDGVDDLLRTFLARRAPGELATDQLLNAVFLRKGGVDLPPGALLDAVLHRLGGAV